MTAGAVPAALAAGAMTGRRLLEGGLVHLALAMPGALAAPRLAAGRTGRDEPSITIACDFTLELDNFSVHTHLPTLREENHLLRLGMIMFVKLTRRQHGQIKNYAVDRPVKSVRKEPVGLSAERTFQQVRLLFSDHDHTSAFSCY